ncbi:MAG: SEC-C domain-containing protein [Candidatus Scalindua rubra]|nr:SEC-C domain-containing protein [Candidatus Scalindua rubra]TWU36822.1 SEC-C motif protein [Candidatus Brocadiaceae bacterium S225]
MNKNDACHCGSGLRYDECHGKIPDKYISKTVEPNLFSRLPENIQKKIIEDEKKTAKQGAVRPIISLDAKGYKFVAVGNQLHYSKNWKTFHDFLHDYIKKILDPKWGNAELKKPFEQRHPVIQWYNSVCTFLKKNIKKEGEIHSAVCTGIVGAYLSLAYDLYLLRNHGLLQNRLIARLKDAKQFQGARYEIYVTASFIKADFEIEFEDETDRSTTHCEFVATHRNTGKKYSVEAKSRHRLGFLGHPGVQPQDFNTIKLRIGNLINNALKKEAAYTRIILIDVNMPPEEGKVFEKDWFKKLLPTLDKIEKKGIDGKPCPPAYVFFTNHPYHYVGEEVIEPTRDFLMTAINVPGFKAHSRKKGEQDDPPVIALWDSINLHNTVPHEL